MLLPIIIVTIVLDFVLQSEGSKIYLPYDHCYFIFNVSLGVVCYIHFHVGQHE